VKRLLVPVALVAALALPGTALAGVTKTDKRNAAKECKAERGDTDASREAFADRYGTNANDRNAFGKCVSQKAREEASERRAARRKAKKECKAKGRRGRALRRCVARRARKIKAKADRKDRRRSEAAKNAAKECDEERGDTDASREAFAEKYGTNRNDRNAFGKCVSGKARD
jgi:hypothetical protein